MALPFGLPLRLPRAEKNQNYPKRPLRIWPLEKMAKNDQRKAPPSFSHFFASVFTCFRPCLHFSLALALLRLSVSDLSWLSVFALFRIVRLLPFSGCP